MTNRQLLQALQALPESELDIDAIIEVAEDTFVFLDDLCLIDGHEGYRNGRPYLFVGNQ